MKLGYWDVYAKAAPARYMLWYKGQEYEDHLYTMASASDAERWQAEKNSMLETGVLLPNLPYLVDGDQTIAESSAINRYLGRKLDLDCSEEKKVLRDQLETVFEQNMFGVYRRFAYKHYCMHAHGDIF